MNKQKPMKKSELIQLTLDESSYIDYMCNAVKRTAQGFLKDKVDSKECQEILHDITTMIDGKSLYTTFLRDCLGIHSIYENEWNPNKQEFLSFLRRKRLEFMRDQYIIKGE